MSVGAICFTSSGSNGGCWVVLVFPRLYFFFLEKWVFFPHTRLTLKKKSLRDLHQKKNFPSKKKRDLRQKKKLRDLRQKIKIKKRLTLFSTSCASSQLLFASPMFRQFSCLCFC